MSSWLVDNEAMTHRGSRRNAMPWPPEFGAAAVTRQICEFDFDFDFDFRFDFEFEFASAYLTKHAALIEDGAR
jgi:hypothetical protein